MKITLISDTHTAHNQLQLSGGDILIHAGDLCNRGTEMEAIDFLNWFSKQEYKYKIFIAGNHDFYFERESTESIFKMIPNNIIYLNDSFVIIEGLKIWGTPITPFFFNWAFNRHRGDEIKKHWDLIPNDIDILISHGPPKGILDLTAEGDHVGCKDLLDLVEKIKPKYHIFGHIHEAYGIQTNEKTTFINASIMNRRYNPINLPIDFELITKFNTNCSFDEANDQITGINNDGLVNSINNLSDLINSKVKS